jgi:tetratricopeptide (TPR) repeat protein
VSRARIAFLAVTSLMVACSRGTITPADRGAETHRVSQVGAATHPEVRLPRPAGRFAPARTELAPEATLTGSHLADIARCDGCHAEIVAQWRSSAHAFASLTNPIYRASVDDLREVAGNVPSRFCGGCHDPALLVDGAMDRAFDPEDARSHAGVSCGVCHGADAAEPDGNGSYVLRPQPIFVPSPTVPSEVKRHIASAAPLRSPKLCASCHRAFLTPESGSAHFFAGADDATPWLRSAYAGSLAERIDEPLELRDCAGCHMPSTETQLPEVAADGGRVRSHRMLGGHSWLAAMQHDDALLTRYAEHLKGAASIDVAAVRVNDRYFLAGEPVSLEAGAEVTLDVVVFNERVGHRFPGGTLDIQDTWLELVVDDARGVTLAEAGTRHSATGEDSSAHVLHARLVDSEGEAVLAHRTHRFRAVAYDQSVLPRDADVVRFSFRLPLWLSPTALPLKVVAELRHRSRSLDMQRAACDAEKSERGQSFARAATKLGRRLEPCAAQPVLEVARTEALLGAARPVEASTLRPRWQRLYRHGLALLDTVGDHVHEATPSLRAALEELKGDDPVAGAQIRLALARLSARQGRAEDALSGLEAAEALLPDHPAIARARGEVLARVWRFEEAIAPLSRASWSAPLDDLGWSALATALGSVGRQDEAREAARQGLSWQPRSETLLRAQALSFAEESSAARRGSSALDAYLVFREHDEASALRRRCSERSQLCRLERIPVHTHRMRAARSLR